MKPYAYSYEESTNLHVFPTPHSLVEFLKEEGIGPIMAKDFCFVYYDDGTHESYDFSQFTVKTPLLPEDLDKLVDNKVSELVKEIYRNKDIYEEEIRNESEEKWK